MIRHGALETDRLVIRPFRQEDVADLVAIFGDPLVARYVGDGEPLSAENAMLWVVRSGENVQRHGYGTGAVVERESGLLIGWAGFARPEDGPEQIIYGLATDHWHRGFGREIVAALIGFADARGMADVAATVDPANERSIALLIAHGFRRIEHGHGGDPDSDFYRRTPMNCG